MKLFFCHSRPTTKRNFCSRLPPIRHREEIYFRNFLVTHNSPYLSKNNPSMTFPSQINLTSEKDLLFHTFVPSESYQQEYETTTILPQDLPNHIKKKFNVPDYGQIKATMGPILYNVYHNDTHISDCKTTLEEFLLDENSKEKLLENEIEMTDAMKEKIGKKPDKVGWNTPLIREELATIGVVIYCILFICFAFASICVSAIIYFLFLILLVESLK